jgi:hypothetical protein
VSVDLILALKPVFPWFPGYVESRGLDLGCVGCGFSVLEIGLFLRLWADAFGVGW